MVSKKKACIPWKSYRLVPPLVTVARKTGNVEHALSGLDHHAKLGTVQAVVVALVEVVVVAAHGSISLEVVVAVETRLAASDERDSGGAASSIAADREFPRDNIAISEDESDQRDDVGEIPGHVEDVLRSVDDLLERGDTITSNEPVVGEHVHAGAADIIVSIRPTSSSSQGDVLRATNIVRSRSDELVCLITRHRDLVTTLALTRETILCVVVGELRVPWSSGHMVGVVRTVLRVGSRVGVLLRSLRVRFEHCQVEQRTVTAEVDEDLAIANVEESVFALEIEEAAFTTKIKQCRECSCGASQSRKSEELHGCRVCNTDRSKECEEGMRSDRRHVGKQRGGLSAMYTPADCSIANLPTAIYRVKQLASRHKRGSGWSAGRLPPIGVPIATGGLEHSLHRLTDTRFQLVPALRLAGYAGYACRP